MGLYGIWRKDVNILLKMFGYNLTYYRVFITGTRFTIVKAQSQFSNDGMQQTLKRWP